MSLGSNFYGEKVNISICSEAAVSKGNRRFLASPETEISVSNYLYSFNKQNRNIISIETYSTKASIVPARMTTYL